MLLEPLVFVDESQLGSKTLPSCANNFSLFERQVLACYWASVETEHLAVLNQVSMGPELPITVECYNAATNASENWK
jgi:hypothetical protein